MTVRSDLIAEIAHCRACESDLTALVKTLYNTDPYSPTKVAWAARTKAHTRETRMLAEQHLALLDDLGTWWHRSVISAQLTMLRGTMTEWVRNGPIVYPNHLSYEDCLAYGNPDPFDLG